LTPKHQNRCPMECRLMETLGVFSQGESLQELEENIREAYHLMLAEEALPDVT